MRGRWAPPYMEGEGSRKGQGRPITATSFRQQSTAGVIPPPPPHPQTPAPAWEGLQGAAASSVGSGASVPLSAPVAAPSGANPTQQRVPVATSALLKGGGSPWCAARWTPSKGSTTHPPIHTWRIPSSKGKQVPGSANQRTHSAFMPPPPPLGSRG